MLATRQVGRGKRARAHSYWQASLLARAGIAPSTTMTRTDNRASFHVAQARKWNCNWTVPVDALEPGDDLQLVRHHFGRSILHTNALYHSYAMESRVVCVCFSV